MLNLSLMASSGGKGGRISNGSTSPSLNPTGHTSSWSVDGPGVGVLDWPTYIVCVEDDRAMIKTI